MGYWPAKQPVACHTHLFSIQPPQWQRMRLRQPHRDGRRYQTLTKHPRGVGKKEQIQTAVFSPRSASPTSPLESQCALETNQLVSQVCSNTRTGGSDVYSLG